VREVNLYTHRHYEADDDLFRAFEQETGIRVNVIKAGEDELIQRMESEGPQCPADLLITVDGGRLNRAKTRGLLQPLRSEALERQVPPHLRDSEGYWWGLTQRARVMVYARGRVKPEALSRYEDLALPQWKGRLMIRSSESIYNQSWMASLLHHMGPDSALAWAKALVANMARPPKGNDRDQVKALLAGEGDVAVVNTYYLGLMSRSKDELERRAVAAVGVIFPNSQDRGTHVNVSGAGMARYAPHPEEARLLLEYLTRPASQAAFSAANSEYPVNPEAPLDSVLQSWGSFRADTMRLDRLGVLNREAVMLMDQAGWK
jgi:iron(III) transport system substrate-binding protein